MKNNVKKIVDLIIPCLIIGFALALFIGLFIMLSYVFLWGIVIGAIIWIGLTIKSYFSPAPTSNKKNGRIIEHKDKD